MYFFVIINTLFTLQSQQAKDRHSDKMCGLLLIQACSSFNPVLFHSICLCSFMPDEVPPVVRDVGGL